MYQWTWPEGAWGPSPPPFLPPRKWKKFAHRYSCASATIRESLMFSNVNATKYNLYTAEMSKMTHLTGYQITCFFQALNTPKLVFGRRLGAPPRIPLGELTPRPLRPSRNTPSPYSSLSALFGASVVSPQHKFLAIRLCSMYLQVV